MMRNDATLRSLDFQTSNGYYISSVRCILTDFSQSPTFATHARPQNSETVNFAPATPVSRVQARCDSSGVYSLHFFGILGSELLAYNPANYTNKGPVHHIATNEHLIGVYGVIDPQSECFKAFGFNVKVKDE